MMFCFVNAILLDLHKSKILCTVFLVRCKRMAKFFTELAFQFKSHSRVTAVIEIPILLCYGQPTVKVQKYSFAVHNWAANK